MNAIERRISTTFVPGILTEIREELNGFKGKISDKNWDRMNDMLRARSRFLSRGPVEESVEVPAGLPVAKVHSLRKDKRKIKWIPITRKDGAGCVWLDGWNRPKGSRKSHLRKMLTKPRLLFDPKKVVERVAEKKKTSKKKSKKELV